MNRQHIKFFVCVLLIIVTIGFIKVFRLTDYLSINYFHRNLTLLKTIIDEHYVDSVSMFMAAFIGSTALSIPGSSVFTTVAGLLFGWAGLLYALTAATLGALILFLASRYFIGSWVQQKYTRQLQGFNSEFNLHAHHYLLVIRFIAVLPFCLVNMLSGLTVITLKDFIPITFFGLIPVSVVYIFAGIQLSHLATPDDFFTPPVMIAFGVFVLFKVALVPVVFKIAKRLMKLLSIHSGRIFSIIKK